MKQFTVFKNGDTYRLLYVNDKAEQVDYGELADETIVPRIEMIAKWIDNLKSEDQQQLEALEQKHHQAFLFVVSTATDEEKLELIDIYPSYQIDKTYDAGDEFKWEGSIYRVLQIHTSQEVWKPNQAPSLYLNINNKIEIQEFRQPTGSHDAYQAGDEVIYQGYIWTSIINNNTWSPSDYPQGWQKGASV